MQTCAEVYGKLFTTYTCMN